MGKKHMTEETKLEDALAGDTTDNTVETVQEVPAEVAAEEHKPEESPKGIVNDDGGITVPLKALHEVRDSNRALKAELDALRQASQPAAEPEVIPDPIDDPQGYASFMQTKMDQRVGQAEQQFHNRLLDISEAGAVKAHGSQAVESVKEWFAKQPVSFQQEAQAKADPYDYAIQQQQRQELTEKLTADPSKIDQLLKLLEGKPAAAPSVPGTTATHQSVGARKGPEWSGPTPLDSIL